VNHELSSEKTKIPRTENSPIALIVIEKSDVSIARPTMRNDWRENEKNEYGDVTESVVVITSDPRAEKNDVPRRKPLIKPSEEKKRRGKVTLNPQPVRR